MTQAAILCRATDDIGSKWLSVIGPDEWKIEAAYGTLEQAVERVKSHFAYEWTFTTRSFDDAIATYLELPDDIAKLGQNSHATILCPEGGGVENKWATLHRVGMSGAIVGTGLDGKFRPQCLTERVVEWFVRQQWRSFAPPRISEKHEPAHQQAHRPAHHRELLVRHGWAAREIAPDAFAPVRSGPALAPEAEAKRLAKLPQNRAAARRMRHQANDARFRAEAAARQALRDEVAT